MKLWDIISPKDVLNHTYNHKPVSFIHILPTSYDIFITYIVFFISFCLLKNTHTQNKELTNKNEQLKKQQAEIATLTKAKSEVEYKLLNSQINPHFLYNALNAFYTRAMAYNEELANGIATLSDVMRYALSANLRSDGQVLLSEEVAHIHNVIDIYRLRFEDNMFLNFTVNGNVEGIYIQPLVLITLAENVFKHGNIHLRDFPATMTLTVTDTQIRFKTWNKNKKGIKDSGTGIGVQNARERLNNAYKNKYRIETKNTGEEYFALLEINYK
jgi:LytS/YehU family sensor histidine kinase